MTLDVIVTLKHFLFGVPGVNFQGYTSFSCRSWQQTAARHIEEHLRQAKVVGDDVFGTGMEDKTFQLCTNNYGEIVFCVCVCVFFLFLWCHLLFVVLAHRIHALGILIPTFTC